MGTGLRSRALFAVVGALAASIVAPSSTPIDRALPFVVALLFFTTETQRTQRLCASVVILLPAIFFTHEHTRLLAYAVILAIGMALIARDEIAFVIAGVLLLRWIPIEDVVIWRELLILAGALAVFVASRSALLAVAAALFTPAFPARYALIPFLIAIVLAFLPRVRLPAVATALLFLMWPWSGILARAFPAFLRSHPAPANSQPVWMALAPGQSVSIDAPPGSHRATVIASAANASRLRRGTPMGTIEGRMIRIGDVADFGYTRREQFFRAHNPAPAHPLADVKDYGQSAWLHTAALIDTPVRAGAIHVTAAPTLPPGARLQIEAVAFE